PRSPGGGGIALSFSSGLFQVPELFSDYIDPKPGWRAALGYEFRNLFLGAEIGRTHVLGTNPLVLDIGLTHLTFRAAYNLPLFAGIGIRGDLGAGLTFSKVEHYENAIAVIAETPTYSDERTPLAEARLYLTYSLPASLRLPVGLRLYAGGGLDVLFEDGGPIPLPLIQAGISVLVPVGRKPKNPEPLRPEPLLAVLRAAAPPEPEPPEIPPGTVRFLPDLAEPTGDFQSGLAETARLLNENPTLKVTLRGYTADFGTPAGRSSLSLARAASVARHLTELYGIEPERIALQNLGSQAVPELADGSPESCRAVEMFVAADRLRAEPAETRQPGTVLFLPDLAEPTGDFRTTLAENPAMKVTLCGYAAPFGTAEERLSLSLARAASVARYLTELYGIGPERISLRGLGSQASPAFADGSPESCRAVEIIPERT
ncbi:MAG: OmpA family protein, partial [Treponema sp.]|nr:OmpA family protein [Treponema sp.]